MNEINLENQSFRIYLKFAENSRLRRKPSFARLCHYPAHKRGHADGCMIRSRTRGIEMGFLIRMAFWFSLVLLALPLSVGPDED
ncbi:MAG: hypothetical protein E5V92_11245, partial [Mesorhizobium sp.]